MCVFTRASCQSFYSIDTPRCPITPPPPQSEIGKRPAQPGNSPARGKTPDRAGLQNTNSILILTN